MTLRELLDHVDLDTQAIELRLDTGKLDRELAYSSRENGPDIPKELLNMEVRYIWAKDYELCDGNEPPLEIDLIDERGVVDESRNCTLTFSQLKKLVMEG